MNNELERYSRAIGRLRESNPAAAQRIEAAAWPTDLVPARNGVMTLKIGRRWLHSPYDPDQEAARLLDAAGIAPGAVIICLGLGLGYHLAALARRRVAFASLLIIEPDAALAKQCLRLHDLEWLFNCRNVCWHVGLPPQQLFEAITAKSAVLMLARQVVLAPPGLTQTRQDYFDAVIPRVIDALRTAAVTIGTATAHGRLMLRNAACNVARCARSPGIARLRGQWSDYPAVIISAGPSLDKNITVLRQARGRALLLCTDTAYPAVVAAGVEPDLVGTIDFRPESARHFSGMRPTLAPLLFDIEAAPESVAAYAGPLLCATNTAPAPQWFNQALGDKGTLDKGMSVAHFLFAAARYFGCAPVIFVGQDLAHSGGVTHAVGTRSRRDAADTHNGVRQVSLISELDGQELSTGLDMYIYQKHFASLVSGCSCVCINATEGGAGIPGTRAMSLEAALARYAVRALPAMPPLPGDDEAAARDTLVPALRALRRQLDAVRTDAQALRDILAPAIAVYVKKPLDQQRAAVLLAGIREPASRLRAAEEVLRLVYAETLPAVMQLEAALNCTDSTPDDMVRRLTANQELQQAISRGIDYFDHCIAEADVWSATVAAGSPGGDALV